MFSERNEQKFLSDLQASVALSQTDTFAFAELLLQSQCLLAEILVVTSFFCFSLTSDEE